MDDILSGLTENYLPSAMRTAAAAKSGAPASAQSDEYKGKNGELDMTDFLYLMVEQFKNQTIDNTASTADMMNQLVQMSVMQAVTNVTTAVSTLVDANTLTYASSLVGKEVTIGQYDKDGKLQEIVGTVTATGAYQGQQVIFVNDKSYLLSDIMAIGKLPDAPEKDDGAGDAGKPDDSGGNGGSTA